MSVSELVAAISAAFADVPYPGDDDLVSGDVSYDREYRSVAQAFRGKDWRELSLDFVFVHKDDLPFLSPAALRYFLPAYLLACLQHADELDTAPANVALNLTPPGPCQVAGFTAAEARAIAGYLQLAEARERRVWLPRTPPENLAAAALPHWLAREHE